MRSTVRKTVPILPFRETKERILGRGYELSLAFVGDRVAKTLNERYRGRSYTPNVLSFPLSPRTGEIVIDLRQARREHRMFGQSFDAFVLRLFAHGCLHLKGWSHGSRMDARESAIVRAFERSSTSIDASMR